MPHLRFHRKSLTESIYSGMSAGYPVGAIIGKVLDYYGPWACSLVAACFFSTGFGLFAREIANTPDDITQPSTSSFYRLVLYFSISSLGAAFSYVYTPPFVPDDVDESLTLPRWFSSVFAASKNFPGYIGVASGATMALFGLSPTFLSLLASRCFTSPDDELDVAQFLQFLAILCGCVHLLGGLTLQVLPPASENVATEAGLLDNSEDSDEHATLLLNMIDSNGDENRQSEVQVEVMEEEPTAKQSALDVLKDCNFWALAFFCFVPSCVSRFLYFCCCRTPQD
jgi:hypothetical protein